MSVVATPRGDLDVETHPIGAQPSAITIDRPTTLIAHQRLDVRDRGAGVDLEQMSKLRTRCHRLERAAPAYNGDVAPVGEALMSDSSASNPSSASAAKAGRQFST